MSSSPCRFFLLILFTALLSTSCDGPERKAATTHKEKAEHPLPQDAPPTLSKDLETFTGAHTRAVWTSTDKAGRTDPFVNSENNMLVGIDSADGRGIRRLLPGTGNFARPLLSHDGTKILYTEKNITRKGKAKHYRPVIHLANWTSGKSKKLADGYAVDAWLEPSTGIEWIFAVHDLVPSTRTAIEARKLIRFPLNAPDKIETVYSDTPIGPDNIQLSRGGSRASGLFPWPHGGIFSIQDKQWTANKLLTGCWPSLAPDDSGVSWIFDGGHRSAYVFADDGRAQWKLPLNTSPLMKNAEVYHPRWSNHARFIVLSGPYIKTTGESGSIISKGGASAQIHVGKLNAKATKVESWFQISHDERGDAYPDLWIANGDQSSLADYQIPSTHVPAEATHAVLPWPIVNDGVLFQWKDREALNTFTPPSGVKQEALLEGLGAARHGRFSELLLDGGEFEAHAESARFFLDHLQKGADFTLEALVFPGQKLRNGSLIRSPFLSIALEADRLLVSDPASGKRSTSPIPTAPFHLCLTRAGGSYALHLNGASVSLEDSGRPAAGLHQKSTLVFGGEFSGGLLRIAMFDHALNDDQIAQASQAAAVTLQALPPAPARVKLLARLSELSAMPTAEGIDPYTSSLIAYVYDVEKVIEGDCKDTRVLVKHWGMLGRQPVRNMPRELGKTYELELELESDHPYLKGERVMDDTLTALDLSPWFDVSPPQVNSAASH